MDNVHTCINSELCAVWWKDVMLNWVHRGSAVYYSLYIVNSTKPSQTLYPPSIPHTGNSSKPPQPYHPPSCPHAVNSKKPLHPPSCQHTFNSNKPSNHYHHHPAPTQLNTPHNIRPSHSLYLQQPTVHITNALSLTAQHRLIQTIVSLWQPTFQQNVQTVQFRCVQSSQLAQQVITTNWYWLFSIYSRLHSTLQCNKQHNLLVS